ERVDRAEALQQGRQLVLCAAEDERPALRQLRGNQPAGLRAGRDPGAPLALVERPRLVVAPHLAREVDRMEVPLAVPLQREQRERRREAVRDTRLDGDARADMAQ